MKKNITFIAVGIVAALCLFSGAWAAEERRPMTFKNTTDFNEDASFHDRLYKGPVIINNIGQFGVFSMDLTNLGSASLSSGASLYFVLKPDRTHIVDIYAIQKSVNDYFGYDEGGVTSIQGFSGVTLIMFDASKYPYSTAEVEIGVTGTTGYDRMKTGATPVQIWQNPGTDNMTGVTNYSNGAHAARRQMMGIVSSASPYGFAPASGIPYGASNSRTSPISVLKRPGDRLTLRAMNSSVSAYIVDLSVSASSLGRND